MCDCKSKIEGRYLELFKEKYPDAEGHEVELKGYGFCLNRESNHVELAPFMAMSGTYVHTFKNGKKKPKKAEQSIFFNYCPFCGESIGRGTVVPD
jgi:hypothetical protein